MEISARRFDANGNPVGQQLSVNQTTTYNQYTPSIGVDADANFVIGWTSEHQDGWENGVYARLYAADGTAQTGEIRLNDTWVNNQWMNFYGLGVAPDGTFAAAWASGITATNEFDMVARRFAPDGSPMTDELPVNTYTPGLQAYGSVAVAPDGEFVVMWVSDGQDGSGLGVYAQEFSSEGTKIGDEIRVNETTNLHQHQARVAADGKGNFVVAYTTQGAVGGGQGIVGGRLGGYSTVVLDSATTTIPTVNYGDYGPPVYESLTVTATVTAGAPGYEDLYFWRYHVHNNDYSQYWPYGVGIFELNLSYTYGLSNVRNTLGWGYQIGVPTGASIIRWSGQPVLGPGGHADFSFTTPVMAIGLASAAVEEMFAGADPVPGPASSNVLIGFYGANLPPSLKVLRVAKWENSFESYTDINGVKQVRLKDDFISPDPDRFGVYVKDPAANKRPTEIETVQVSILTTSARRVPQALTLTESGPNTGEFNGPWLLLVSNDKDLETPLRDYTFKVKLGDQVYASYIDGTGKLHYTDAAVPVQKVVKVHVTVLDGSGMTITDAEKDIMRANEVFAQVGIRLEASYQKVAEPTTAGVKVDLTDGLGRVDEFSRAG